MTFEYPYQDLPVDSDEPFRCRCAPPGGRCKNRLTQEDLLCDYCRTSEFCAPYLDAPSGEQAS